ncbi:uncharacterized protein LOC107216740 isoform X1 [Neodiprion lecontei]|uniref:Uncharacterized protein LOC107216740 isoform X1 n=1 Tax=Neodiprion lecontei TaxID=441921 RepID=A0ABM3FV73_NEOLC|nr:uncharacterized protein LOC107216740 isoform X1 [Neodiprion lecontei]
MASRECGWCSSSLRPSSLGVIATTATPGKVLCLLVLFTLVQPGIIFAQSVSPRPREPSLDFTSHSVIHPKLFHARTKREIFSTKENDLRHAELLTVAFTVDGTERVLDLRLNNDLIPVGHQLRRQVKKGSFDTYTPSKEEIEVCQYQGSVRGIPDSWAALSTCKGLNGVLFDGKSLHYIQPQDETIEAPHFIYKHDNFVANNTCGYEGTQHRHSVHNDIIDNNEMIRHKRDAGLIRGPYNSNKNTRYVELVMVVDKLGYDAMSRNLTRVHQHAKDLANIVNALYTPLNIFVALVGIEVWTEVDEISLSVNGEMTLSNFLKYRREHLVRNIPNDNAQLLTKVEFEGGVVSKALKGPICTFEFSGGVSMDRSNVIGLVAATIAHAMGHNFGMEHDTLDCSCPEDRCIMAPSSGSTGPTHWSSCSLEYLALAFEHGMDYCLRNKPEKLFGSSMCGNGFVEPGEQCDCGLEENCDNPCCNATSCMLHANASCATGECCDFNTCRPKAAGMECRSAEHECDLPEYCSGQSEFCPSDVYKIDGETCSDGKAFCYQGTCRTRDSQCKLLWGPSGSSSDSQCYVMNNKGSKYGNCGYNRVNDTYIRCNDADSLCGMLHCKHLNERLEFGMEEVAILSHSFLNSGGQIIPCKTAIIDLGLNEMDPGLVPNGAKCGTDKMCLNQKCVPVAEVKLSTPAGNEACPNNCNGNGVCNSLGHCHCNPGFPPPLCNEEFNGGSIDSGPVKSRVPSSDFNNNVEVTLTVSHPRTKRELSSTKEDGLKHAELLTVAFTVDGVEHTLDLRLNTDLIPVGHQLRHQIKKGSFETVKPSKEEIEICQYQGSIRGIPDSWAAVSTCRGMSGVVFDGKTLHYIHPQDETLEAPHFLYKHDDLVANNTCGYTGTQPHSIRDHLENNRMLRYKRDTGVIRGPYNANKESRYVELVMVIDQKGYFALGKNMARVYHHCKDIANIINALYSPLNIFIALVGIEVWTEVDEITLSSNGETTLSNFLKYRREHLVRNIPNDNAQLLTKVEFEGGVVGKALKGPICTFEFSGGVSMDHSNVIGLVAATIAHEMGHNFGMEHDTLECSCPEDRCIMAPSSGSTGPTHWSSCSLEYLALAFEHGMDYCLRNKPEKLFGSSMCGNGFVEPGEQCDCGLEENCDNPCCNATSCMLHANASCATGECCDFNTCRPKAAGMECRSAEHECDLPEYCSGQSEFCPSDVYKIDGETCSDGKAFCYQGTCRTRNDQCKLLWGPSGSSSDSQCYVMNNKGSKYGNCGYNRVNDTYIRCNDADSLCGMLHCKHLNERLEFGMETVAILSHSFLNSGGQIIPCRTAIVDLGLNEVDPGLVPDGAKCGTGKMCVNQKCMPVAAMRLTSPAGSDACPNNCSGNGVCNSQGHCHCRLGFQPPRCDETGVGGSIDSGPAEDPNARRDFLISLYVIFFGIVPVLVLIGLFVWSRHSGRYKWKKGATSAVERAANTLSIKTIERSSPIPRNIETIDSTLSQDSACASLLPKAERDERFNNNLFGQFKGYTITPIQNLPKLAEPSKPAPPPPTVPTVAIKTNVKLAQRSNTLRSTLSSGVVHANQISIAPALPPLNPGCNARPLISSPVLSTTTCTSVEIIGPKVPSRPAPDIPVKVTPEILTITSTSIPPKPPRPNSTPLTNVILPEAEKKPEKGSALNRIASILRPNSSIMRSNSQPAQKEDKNTNTLPRNQHHKANKVIDKEILRNLEISNPIPQKEIEISTPAIPVVHSEVDGEEKKAVVMRAQSMRDSKITAKPAIHTFGSMRQASAAKRPTSIPASTRPTSPPPGPPRMPSNEKISETGVKIPGLPGYQNPPIKSAPSVQDNAYDDCMNLMNEPSLGKIMEESPSSDNIYAVIEESVPEKSRNKVEPQLPVIQNEYKSPKPLETSPKSGSSADSMGLLSEIVSEISNRNFDSIYSTSTLARKKKEKEEMDKNSENLGSNSSLGTYINSSHYKAPGSIYSTSPSSKFNSASSTTSSGYLNPSAVNVPRSEDKKDSDKPKAQLIEKDSKSVCKSKLTTLNSNNPNINDEMSKQLGMKPSDGNLNFKPFSTTTNKTMASLATSLKKDEKKEESKIPAKPPLNRTKTPPNLGKPFTSKQMLDSNTKTGKQGATESSLKPTRQGSDTSLKTSRQGSETSLKSSKQSGSLNKSNPSLNKSNTNLNRSSNNLNKNGSSSNLSTMSLKSTSSSPKSSALNLTATNSPDLVSSCSNSSQNMTKSPDVLGNNPKAMTGTMKNIVKTPTMTRSVKTPTTPPKPTAILMKSASLVDKKKSPTGNTSIAKSLSAKESTANKTALQTKTSAKNEAKVGGETTKVNPVQKAAGSKSNVASLQQRFEINKNTNPTRTMSAIGKKSAVGKTIDVGRSSSAKK